LTYKVGKYILLNIVLNLTHSRVRNDLKTLSNFYVNLIQDEYFKKVIQQTLCKN